MPIFVAVIILLFLGSVSAVEDNTNSTHETMAYNSQNEITINEINNPADDTQKSNVSGDDKNDILGDTGNNAFIKDNGKNQYDGKITGYKVSDEIEIYFDAYSNPQATFYLWLDGNKLNEPNVYVDSSLTTKIKFTPPSSTSPGDHTIKFASESGYYFSNTLTYTLEAGSSSGSGGSGGSQQEYNNGLNASDLSNYYIRIYDFEENEFLDIEYGEGWYTLVTKIFAKDGSTSFPSAVYPSESYMTSVNYVDDGNLVTGYSFRLMANGTAYQNNVVKNSFSFDFGADNGVHRAYSYYTYNGVTYYSNVFYVYGNDIEKKTSTPTLRLYDKKNPTNKTLYYNIYDNVSIINSLTDSIFGSSLSGHVFTRTVNQKEYILENLDIYLNGQLLYKHGIGSLYSQYGDGILVNIGDDTTNGFNLYLNHSGWYNLTAKYYGNSLGLLPTESEILSIYVKDENEDALTVKMDDADVNYLTKANLTVRGSDGEYTVFVDKYYEVSVVNGIGYVTVDVLAGNKTYNVSIVSKTNSSIKNSAKLTVNPISPNLEIDASKKEFTYGDVTSILISKHNSANGIVHVYDGDVELNSLNNLKLSGGEHIIKAVYAGDGNFTTQESSITINVKKALNNLTLTVTNETYPNKVTINLKAFIPGEYDVQVDIDIYKVTVNEEGIGITSIFVNPGSHIAYVNYAETQNYSSSFSNYNFHVNGTVIGLNVTADKNVIEVGESINFNTSSKVGDVNGNVTFKSDDGWQITAGIGEIVSYTPTSYGTHIVEVSYKDNIYNPQSVTVNVLVNKKTNKVKVEVNNSTYPNEIYIKVTADISGDYTVDINGTEYIVQSGDVGKPVKLDAGSYYAKIIIKNDTYNAITTNSSFKVNKGINNIIISAEDVQLPNQVAVKVKATKAGIYTVKFNDNYSVNVTVSSDESEGTSSILLPANSYNPVIINYNDNNYDLNVTSTQFTVKPSPITASLEIRDGNNPDVNMISGNLIYSFKFEYKLTHSDAVFTSQNITIYCNEFEYTVINNPTAGDFTNIGGNILLTDIGEYEFKAVWQATTNNGSFNASSNIVKINVNSNPSSMLSIRDSTFTNNSTITLKGKDKVIVSFEYLLTRPNTNYYLYEKNLTVYVNGEMIESTTEVADGFYAKISFTYAASDDIRVYVSFKGGDYNPTIYNEISNVLTYHIVIDDSQEKTLSVEASSVLDSENALIVVKSNVDGNYIVNVNNKNYNVSVVNGKGNVSIDRLEANSYEVIITSKDNSSFNNKTTLIITNSIIKEDDTIFIQVLNATYPVNATVTVKTNKPGEYILNVGGKDYNFTIINETNITIDRLPANEYDVYVKAKNNESFNNSTKLNISKGLNNVKVSVSSINYLPLKVNINVTADVDGIYVVNINTTDVNVEVKNGFGNTSVELNKGTYTAKVENTCIDFDNYTVTFSNATFTVFEKTDVITIRDSNHPQNSTITINDNNCIIEYKLIKPDDYFDQESLYIIVNNKTKAVTPIEYGSYIKYVYAFNQSGIYTVQFNYTYMKNDISLVLPTELSNILIYNVTVPAKINESISISINNVTYPDYVNASFKSSVDGDYVLIINKLRYNATVVNGTGHIIISGLSAGNYNAVLMLKSDETIKNTTSFSVLKADSKFIITSNKTYYLNYGDKLNISYSINSDAKGLISINESSMQILSINAGEKIDNLSLPAGNHTLKIIYSGNQNYTQASDEITVYIGALQNIIELNITNATYPNNISVKIKATLNGNYTLTFDNSQNINIIVENGVFESSFKLNGGNHTAYLVYKDSNSNYESHPVTAYFNIQSDYIGLSADSDLEMVKVNNSVILNTSSNVGFKGDVVFLLPDGTQINASIGQTVHFTPSTVGKHIITVLFKGNENYSPESVNITINAYDEVNLIENALTINSPSDGSNPTFNINLPADANGILSVIVNNETYSEALVNGKACVEIFDLTVGNYTAKVIYTGDGNYPRSEIITNFEVKKVETSVESAFSIKIPKDTTAITFNIEFLNNVSGNVKIIVDDDIEYNLTLTDGKGTITTSKLLQGIHSVFVSYLGDDKYMQSNMTTSFNVFNPKITENTNLNVVYYSNSKFSIRLYGSDGKVLSSQVTSFTVNGITYNTKTNKNGYASLKIAEKPGVYSIVSSSLGISVSNTIVVNHIISAKNLKVKKTAKTLNIKVKLSKVNGVFLKSKKITLKLKGKKYTAKTNKKGVATFKIKKNIISKLSAGKKYTYKVTFLKDTISKKISVKK